MKKLIYFISIISVLASCASKKDTKGAAALYTCPMHPEVICDKQGKCPVCGMALIQVKKTSAPQPDDLELSERQILLGNIHTDTIRQGSIGSEMEVTGTLNVNAGQTAAVSARVMGRIAKLYVKTTGDYVAKGAAIYEVYSEELNAAKQEFMAALQRRSLFTGQSVIDFDELIQSARNKLSLRGMTEGQIKALETQKQAPLLTTYYSKEKGYVTSVDVTEGSYVMEGSTILQLADLSTLWAEAQVYTSQLHKIPDGARAMVEVPGENPIVGKVAFANPEVVTDTRINLLRIVVPNHKARLRPGMPVLVRIQTASKHALTIPTDAIIRDANGATVWLQTAKNRFKSRMVTTGLETDGLTEITSGLRQGDVVVVKGSYLVHSEFILKRGSDPMAGHNH